MLLLNKKKSNNGNFRLNQKLDLGMQLWRYTPMQGPDMRRFERTCEVFYSICEKHIRDSMEKIKNKETNKQKTTLLEYLYEKGCDEAASTAILLDILFAGKVRERFFFHLP